MNNDLVAIDPGEHPLLVEGIKYIFPWISDYNPMSFNLNPDDLGMMPEDLLYLWEEACKDLLKDVTNESLCNEIKRLLAIIAQSQKEGGKMCQLLFINLVRDIFKVEFYSLSKKMVENISRGIVPEERDVNIYTFYRSQMQKLQIEDPDANYVTQVLDPLYLMYDDLKGRFVEEKYEGVLSYLEQIFN